MKEPLSDITKMSTDELLLYSRQEKLRIRQRALNLYKKSKKTEDFIQAVFLVILD